MRCKDFRAELSAESNILSRAQDLPFASSAASNPHRLNQLAIFIKIGFENGNSKVSCLLPVQRTTLQDDPSHYEVSSTAPNPLTPLWLLPV